MLVARPHQRLALSLLLLLLASCSGDPGGSNDKTDARCVTLRDYFITKAWPVLGQRCASCHSLDGLALKRHAKLELQPETYPGFVDTNLASIREMARTEYDDVPLLTLKPTGGNNHGGGVVLEKDSAELEVLRTLVAKVRADDNDDASKCHNAGGDADHVVLQSPEQTLRSASLVLVGKLPPQSELDAVRAGGEAALGKAVDKLMTDEAFYARVRELFNDLLLTDKYYGSTQRAIGTINGNYVKADIYDPWWTGLSSADKTKHNDAVAREPLELIVHVVRNDKPFSEVLTADYTMVNPYSAAIYGAKVAFDDPSDADEWKPAKLTQTYKGENVAIPHAGILSTPMFLNRFPTTPTNRNRHRARVVYKLFLATDILRIAERPIDPTQSTAYNNPPREDPACTTCHTLIDPVAGAFQRFSHYDMERYEPNAAWHKDMFGPGYGAETMPTSDYGQALRWLSSHVVKDPRFVISVVHNVYELLMGRAPLTYPRDQSVPDYQARIAAWRAQDAVLGKIAKAFRDDDENFKTAVRELVLSPLFRAANAAPDMSDDEKVVVGDVGRFRLVTPRALDRKIRALTGVRWESTGGTGYLTSTYRILYGGIDSDAVVARLGQPNAVMAAVMKRMANEVACKATAFDFTKAKDKRLLFPAVDVDTEPEGADAEAAIKANIKHLHARLLGEQLADDSAELAATYKLFVETYKEGLGALADGSAKEYMTYWCRARWDWDQSGAPLALPKERFIEKDPRYVLRAWRAVITYLLSDFSFLYQ